MQIVNDRRALHRIPELDRCLPKTMEYLKSSLSSLKCRLFSPIEDSLCAFFDFGKADAIAFRADCDALPSSKRRALTTLPPMLAPCTPAAMTATWPSFWNWPADWKR